MKEVASMNRTLVTGLTLFLTASLLGAGEVPEDPESAERRGWKDKAEFSLVVTSGNAVSRTFGLANTLTGQWGADSLELKTKAVRAQATALTRTATGTPDSYIVTETHDRRLAAESFAASGSYTRGLPSGVLLKTGAGWERNRFSGIFSRTVLAAGLGYAWIDKPDSRLGTDLSLTYTFRSTIDGGKNRFAGIRAAAAFEKTVGPTASYAGTVLLDENLSRFSDWRVETTHGLTVSMSRGLSLKIGLDLIYFHRPAGEEIPLFDRDAGSTGAVVIVPLKKLDTVFTTSLVIDF
jgi:putative salt-induced outer membrane protein YdiY